MVVDVLQELIKILRVEEYANSQGICCEPINQFLYAVFFPTVLLMILVYILVGRLFTSHKGMSILLSVAVWIFLIVYPPNADYNLYSFFAPISQLWFVAVIFLGLLWILFTRMWPRSGGEGKGGGRGMSLPGGGVVERIRKATFESERNIEEMIRSNITQLEAMVTERGQIKRGEITGTNLADHIDSFQKIKNQTVDLIKSLEDKGARGLVGNPSHYRKELKRVDDMYGHA